MSENLESAIKEICQACGNDRSRLMDVVTKTQRQFGCVCSDAMNCIAQELSIHRVEVESVVSFYAFLSSTPKGKVVIRLCNDVIDKMLGADRVAEVFCQELGIQPGETTPDGQISLEYAPCIGMCDQAPAALINDTVVPQLSCDRAREICRQLKTGAKPESLVKQLGDGNNAHELVHSMVMNNIRETGPVVFAPQTPGVALKKALAMHPAEVINEVNAARLRGRGGAGFPTGMKWNFTRKAGGDQRVIICNADEGEPGTFKDRVILTECAEILFEGMAIAGYAIGAEVGILYLRGEYAYLRAFLENLLQQRREAGLLGKNLCGKDGVDFDIRIQMGAGAYICGEETALISSCEGLRGDPKNRPPFPAQKGYMGRPTSVNNVETFCCVARIVDQGAAWFAQLGSKGSAGTKLISISGDCTKPGVYEIPFGTSVQELLNKAGATSAAAVQIGGPSGRMIAPAQFEQTICYDDLATGGSVMVFGPDRDILDIVSQFVSFFEEESCGYCTPCRVGNVLMKACLEQIRAGNGEPGDLDYLQELGETMKVTSRCGLGQTAANPVLSTLQNFRGLYEALVKKDEDGFQPKFDIQAALNDAETIADRQSVIF